MPTHLSRYAAPKSPDLWRTERNRESNYNHLYNTAFILNNIVMEPNKILMCSYYCLEGLGACNLDT